MTLVRRIKQKLFREGKLRKYFIYALGEIILVMIGILLALQINNWNQERIERTKEIKALSALDKEFELNHKRITTKQNLRNLIVPKIDSYITLIETGKADYYSFKDFHLNQIMHGMTNPSNGVINALISSGEISLITNDSLKYFLADWKNQLENLYENELILWNSELKFIETTTNKIPNSSQKWYDWDLNQLESATEDLLSNVAYRNNLVGFGGCNKIIIEECNEVLAVLDKISTMLNDEINKYQ